MGFWLVERMRCEARSFAREKSMPPEVGHAINSAAATIFRINPKKWEGTEPLPYTIRTTKER